MKQCTTTMDDDGTLGGVTMSGDWLSRLTIGDEVVCVTDLGGAVVGVVHSVGDDFFTINMLDGDSPPLLFPRSGKCRGFRLLPANHLNTILAYRLKACRENIKSLHKSVKVELEKEEEFMNTAKSLFKGAD